MITRLRTGVRHRIHGGFDADRGSVLIWFVITAPVLLLLAVLVVDGGAKIRAGEQASNYSAEAARAASIAVGPYSPGGIVNTRAAVKAANGYLSAAGVRGTVRITGPATVSVTVTVTVDRTGPVSGVTFSITRTATARLLVGVDTGQAP
jgi:Flp pilus assembly protein TadG